MKLFPPPSSDPFVQFLLEFQIFMNVVMLISTFAQFSFQPCAETFTSLKICVMIVATQLATFRVLQWLDGDEHR